MASTSTHLCNTDPPRWRAGTSSARTSSPQRDNYLLRSRQTRQTRSASPPPAGRSDPRARAEPVFLRPFRGRRRDTLSLEALPALRLARGADQAQRKRCASSSGPWSRSVPCGWSCASSRTRPRCCRECTRCRLGNSVSASGSRPAPPASPERTPPCAWQARPRRPYSARSASADAPARLLARSTCRRRSGER